MTTLPPNGRRYLAERPSAGPWVAIGPDAWRFASRKPFPVLVLPLGDDPRRYHWPVRAEPVLLFEFGQFDTAHLERVARALLAAGATFVYPIREALLPGATGPRRGTSWPAYERARHAA